MSLNNWLSLGLGLFFLAFGVSFIWFRKPISAFYARVFGAMDSSLGDRQARASKPSVYMAVGVVALCCAVAEILMGLFRHQWS